MLKTNSQKTVTAGLMLAIGILLPLFTSHGIVLLPGNIFLPMHIPVFLCGFLCGPMYAAILGFILPFLNSAITSMPALYPNAIIMSCELFSYGLITATIHKLSGYSRKLRHIYPTLISAMISGRIVYGIVASALLFVNPSLKKLSVIAAVVQGFPGIIIQLILIPVIITRIYKNTSQKHNAKDDAKNMIKEGLKSCVIVRDNKIISAESTKGIKHIINLYEEGLLNGAFVADTVIGKAAAMIFSLAKIKSCYARTISREALTWLSDHNIDTSYSTLTDYIINRKGDGMCPMEETVINIDDEKTALSLLKAKIEELKILSEKENAE